jgi:hypothetical protein
VRAHASGGSDISTASVVALQGGLGPHVHSARKAGILGLPLGGRRRASARLASAGASLVTGQAIIDDGGRTTTEIAERLVLTESTVRKHVGRVLAKSLTLVCFLTGV